MATPPDSEALIQIRFKLTTGGWGTAILRSEIPLSELTAQHVFRNVDLFISENVEYWILAQNLMNANGKLVHLRREDPQVINLHSGSTIKIVLRRISLPGQLLHTSSSDSSPEKSKQFSEEELPEGESSKEITSERGNDEELAPLNKKRKQDECDEEESMGGKEVAEEQGKDGLRSKRLRSSQDLSSRILPDEERDRLRTEKTTVVTAELSDERFKTLKKALKNVLMENPSPVQEILGSLIGPFTEEEINSGLSKIFDDK